MKTALKRKDIGPCIILGYAQKHPHLLFPAFKGWDGRRRKEVKKRKLELELWTVEFIPAKENKALFPPKSNSHGIWHHENKGNSSSDIHPLGNDSCILHLPQGWRVESMFLHAEPFIFLPGFLCSYNKFIFVKAFVYLDCEQSLFFPLIFLLLNWLAYEFQPGKHL